MKSQNNISSFLSGIKFCVVAFFAAISILGCVKGDIPELNIGANVGKTEARLSVAQPSSSTRTEIDPNDMATVRWSIGDEAAVWASDATSNEQILAGEKFTLRYYGSTYSTAEFSAIIDPLDEERSYRYTAFYPYPNQINADGTVIYNIPTMQSGLYDGKGDIRVADATIGGAITGSTIGGATLSFRSLAHAFKIAVPDGHNHLGGELKELIIEMPTEIAGNFSFDMNNTSAAPIAIAGESTKGVVLNMEGKDEAWLFINPAANVTGDIKIYGVDTDGRYSESYDITLTNHTFAAGRITPIYTKVMEEMAITTIDIAIDENNLGEDIQYINITAPRGVVFKESGSNTATIDVAAGESTLSYYAYFYGDILRDGEVSLEFESEHAVIGGENISFDTIVDDQPNSITRSVPYPIFMNFSTLTKDFSIHDNIGIGASLTDAVDRDYNGWTDLSDYGLPEGWTAGRVGGSASAGSLRICGREEAGDKYPGRLDSPKFSWIKAGKSVKVRVTYNYSGGENEYRLSSWWGNLGDPWYQFGYETRNEEGLTGNTELGNVIQNWTKQGTSGSYTSITNSASHDIGAATNATRASWRASCDKASATPQNGNYWLYIDNIKVQIVQ